MAKVTKQLGLQGRTALVLAMMLFAVENQLAGPAPTGTFPLLWQYQK